MKQLVKLEEKVPAIKTETEDVLEALDEQKKAVYTRISSGKDAITTRLATGKDALVDRLHAGTEAVTKSGPAHLVSSGVNRTLKATENIVDYLLPEKPEDASSSKEKETELKVSGEAEDSSDEEEEEGEEGEKGEEGKDETSAERVKNISRKVKVRVYYRTLHRLDTVQEQCMTTLEHLKTNIDLVSHKLSLNLLAFGHSIHTSAPEPSVFLPPSLSELLCFIVALVGLRVLSCNMRNFQVACVLTPLPLASLAVRQKKHKRSIMSLLADACSGYCPNVRL